MNKLILNQTGGFPLETETLKFMQDAYNIFQSLGEIVGDKSIIKGCETVGSNVTDGVIYWNGELLRFKGGQLQTTIIIVETITNLPFEDGQVKQVYVDRYATFGAGISTVNWADFVRAYPLTSALFVDEVRMYAGDVANIPWGWYLMDGTNGTMDLRDKFPVPYNPMNTDYDTIGKTGGLKDVTLTKANLPNYNLNYNLATTAKLISSKYIGDDGDGWPNGAGDRIAIGNVSSYVRKSEELNIPSLSVAGTISSGGSNTSFDNRPPFKVIGYIQFKGV